MNTLKYNLGIYLSEKKYEEKKSLETLYTHCLDKTWEKGQLFVSVL